MAVYSSDIRIATDQITKATDRLTTEQRRANELKLVELILIYGAQDVQKALDGVKITNQGVSIKGEAKKAQKLSGLDKK